MVDEASAVPGEQSDASVSAAVAGEFAVAKLDVTVFGQAMHIEIPISTGPVAGAALVPIARALGEAIGGRAIEVEAAAGRVVPCRKGCAACCRHLVPLAVSEARAIHALIEAMPEPRRREIRRRFAAIGTALTTAGLRDQILETSTIPADGATAVNLGYFRLYLDCPFLEDESCSIHADRPLACREYLVTSPAAFCADPAAGKIAGVPRPLRINTALIRSDPEAQPARTTPGREPPDHATWVALSTLLDWIELHPSPDARLPGPDLLRRFLAEAFRRDLPAPDAAPRGAGMLDSVS
jgi:Fe-S-cluster containining protein